MKEIKNLLINIDLTPLILSLKISAITTLILLLISLPIAYFLAYKNFKGKSLIESFILLPLVLPSTVLGFYLI
jgi:molybdate transport system permease protein